MKLSMNMGGRKAPSLSMPKSQGGYAQKFENFYKSSLSFCKIFIIRLLILD